MAITPAACYDTNMNQPQLDPRRPAGEVTMRVTGLHCTNCALSLEKHLTRVGAEQPCVDYTSGRTSFKVADREQLSEIVQSLSRLGYTVSDLAAPLPASRHLILHIKTIIAALLTIPVMIAMFMPSSVLHDPILQLILTTPVFLIGIHHFGLSGIRSLRTGTASMDVLIAIGILAAYSSSLISLILGLSHDTIFFEAVCSIVTFVMVGHLLEERAVKKTTSAIESLSTLQPQQVTRIVRQADGVEAFEKVALGEVQVGDLLQVNSGDRVPTDGNITQGGGSFDESMLSGESLPVDRAQGERVIGGSILSSGSIVITATAVGDDTVLSSIVQLVRDAQHRRPSIQRIGDAVSAVFVPTVLCAAVLLLILGVLVFGLTFPQALVRALAVIVVACPCAMGLATPTAIMVALGRAATSGILVRGGDTLERLAQVRHVSFDKTGTLTQGALNVGTLTTYNGYSQAEAQGLLIALQRSSSHPIAQAIVKAYQGNGLHVPHLTVVETKGVGVEGRAEDGTLYACGGLRIAKQHAIEISADLILLKNGALIASLSIKDAARKEAASVISKLKAMGLSISIISGDVREKCEKIAAELGIQRVEAEQLPQEKLLTLRTLQADSRNRVAYVGDGINDAPTLAEASVGISLSSASDVAMHSAQVLLTGATLANLPAAIKLARITVSTIKQNLFWAFFYNVLAIPLAALGYLTPLQGALLMTLSDVVIVGNSLRIKARSLR